MDSDVPTSYLNFNLPDAALCILPASWDSREEGLDVKSADARGPGLDVSASEESVSLHIGYESYIMAQLSAMTIMTLATGGRMTLLRLWRLAMKLGWNDTGNSSSRLVGINYEAHFLVQKVLHWWKADPEPRSIPESEISLAKDLGDVALVEQFFMKRAGLSFWMRPDR